MVRTCLVSLFLALAGMAQTIEGTASNSLTNQPLDGVKVSIAARGKNVQVAVTDGQGGFRIEGLPPGLYSATFSKSGFQGPSRDDEASKTFRLTGSTPVRLAARMTPMAKVSGRVVDATGTPVAGAMVQILGGPVGYDNTTDKQGKFSFDSVAPGAYRLWAQPPKSLKPPPAEGGERMAWASTFFPGVTDANGASRIDLSAGAELWDQEIRLQAARVHRISGVVLDARGEPAPKIRVTLGSNVGISYKDEDRETYAVADAEGGFEFADVTDGIWRLSAEMEKPEKLRAFTAETMAGHDLERVQLRLSPPFTVRGHVVRESPANAQIKRAPILVLLGPSGGGRVFHQGAVDADDQFQIDGVFPGRYTVRPIPPGPPYYLASITMGERELPFQQAIDLISGALPLTIVYKSNGGGVRGTVENCGSATVVFYPQDPGLQISEFEPRAKCGDGGRFEIANMRPGEYYAFAFEQPPGLEAMFFGFSLDQGLINQATHVTVRPGEFTVADLRVTPR